MSTSDLTVTLVGWVGTEPKHYTGTGVTPFTSFRMANTRRYFDRAQNAWTDGRTEWFTVKVWRQSALNVASSLRKGDPVLVHGRLATEQWDGPDGQRTTLVLEALAIGPDLTYGRASFARTIHVPGADGEATATRRGDGGDEVGGGALGIEDPWATDGAVTGDEPDGDGDGVDADGVDADETPSGERVAEAV
jgi:single-strand DNA-binding protein